MQQLETKNINILGEIYRAVVDGSGRTFINLTVNDITVDDFIIPTSNQHAYATDWFIVGLPPRERDQYLIVEFSVFRKMRRSDLCIGVKVAEVDKKIRLIPIREVVQPE